jgi:hypothetical protein
MRDIGPSRVLALFLAVALAAVTQPAAAEAEGTPLRINAGGPEVEAAGVRWLSDRYLAIAGARFANEGLDVEGGTSDPAIYRSERNTGADDADAIFRYVIPVSSGRYMVVIHFAEIYFGTPGNPELQPGSRRFHVWLQGERVLVDYDVARAAGGAARAVTETFLVDADDGVITLTVENGSSNRGKISALEVMRVVPNR